MFGALRPFRPRFSPATARNLCQRARIEAGDHLITYVKECWREARYGGTDAELPGPADPGSGDDLGLLIRQLIVAAELNSSLTAILGGQSGMDSAFVQGDVEMADNATPLQSTANFDAARFSATR